MRMRCVLTDVAISFAATSVRIIINLCNKIFDSCNQEKLLKSFISVNLIKKKEIILILLTLQRNKCSFKIINCNILLYIYISQDA